MRYFKLLGNYNLQGFALCQAIGEFLLVGYCFAPSCWRSAISRFLSCVKLLANYHLQDFALCQAIEDFQLVGYCFAPNYWGSAIFEALDLCQAIGELPFAGGGLRQDIGNYNVQGLALHQVLGKLAICMFLRCFNQAIVSSNLQGIVLPQAIG